MIYYETITQSFFEMGDAPMVTMKDVAKRAGVSVATVSHVINETRFVSEELKQRVLQVIDEMGYQPDAVARSLRRKETQTIGLIVPDNSNSFFAEVARGIEDVGFEQGYSVILCNSDLNLEKELTYLDTLIAKRVDGIIFIAATAQVEHVESLVESGMPIVIADRKMPEIEVDSVLVDNFQGGYEATKHLLDLGHRRIGCITGPWDLTPSADRVAGYKAALSQHGLRADEDLIVRGDYLRQSGEMAVRRFLELSAPPTAIFACNDLMAIGAMKSIHEQGLRVPEDISIVGFDDIALASCLNPPLTTIAQPKYELGKIAAELVIQKITRSDSGEKREIVLDSHLVVRGSTLKREVVPID